MSMTLNAFPSRTWNFLKINDIDCELDFSAFPKVDGDAEIPFDCRKIATGLGKEFDSAFDGCYDASSKPQFFSVAAGTSGDRNLVEIDVSDSTASDIAVNAGKGSDSSLTVVYRGSGTSSCISRIRVNLEENAHIHLIVVNMLGKGAVLYNSVGSCCADSSEIEITEIQVGGSKTYTGTYNDLSGYKSTFTGRLAYVCRDESFLDINQVALQTGKSTVSRFTVDGVLMDKASKTWRGTIDFKRGCSDAIGDEQEDVLLLNPEVSNRSLPVILCDEEDVEGRHGCSVGKLDMEKLFYMQSRGVDYDTAKYLLTKAKVSKLTRFIDDEDLVAEIEEFVEGLIKGELNGAE